MCMHCKNAKTVAFSLKMIAAQLYMNECPEFGFDRFLLNLVLKITSTHDIVTFIFGVETTVISFSICVLVPLQSQGRILVT